MWVRAIQSTAKRLRGVVEIYKKLLGWVEVVRVDWRMRSCEKLGAAQW